MSTVTYHDIHGDKGADWACPRTEFHGVQFRDGHPVELNDDDPRHAAIIDTLDGNPWFTVKRDKAAEAKIEAEANPDPDRYREAGAQAFRDGKPFSIPPRWRKRPAGELWAAGYRQAKAKEDAATDARMNA